MSRDIYLIVYKSHLYASHWAVFVPNETGHHDDGMKAGPGKVINVEGDVNNGFDLLFKRNYDPSECTRGKKLEFLASIDDRFVSDPTDSVTVIEDDREALPGDKLEEIARSVSAPSKTLGVKASSWHAQTPCSPKQQLFSSRTNLEHQFFFAIVSHGRKTL
jgi:hypothetical protein